MKKKSTGMRSSMAASAMLRNGTPLARRTRRARPRPPHYTQVVTRVVLQKVVYGQ
ncbi:hypothetical protein [Cupriavidus sp. TA19]|uniref:hypothetical protein n=1 Tax=Cupriavidus sp. TA19 TaxID=701108 RepID=UPI00295F518D|nr:hypothetical protein [Cupriavidus sp. TA19]